MERESLAWLERASRCSTEFVEPPVAAPPAMAFWIAALVMILDGVTSRRRRSMTILPACLPASAFAAFVAGTLESPIGAIPRNSQTNAMVLAVTCPPQPPEQGHAGTSGD